MSEYLFPFPFLFLFLFGIRENQNTNSSSHIPPQYEGTTPVLSFRQGTIRTEGGGGGGTIKVLLGFIPRDFAASDFGATGRSGIQPEMEGASNGGMLYHEVQESKLCAVHCVNTVLQGPFFSEIDLAALASDLDRRESQMMMEGIDGGGRVGGGVSVTAGGDFLSQESHNVSLDGDFSIQVDILRSTPFSLTREAPIDQFLPLLV